MTKKLLRLLRTVPLALLLVGVASAQTTGTIIGVVTDASTGKPVAGALVVATSPNLQGEQTAVTDNAGSFRLVLLPSGEYKLAVQLEGFKPFERTDIRVSIDRTIRANLSVVPEAVQLEEQVVRTGAPVINVASAEAGAVVSQEFIASVPIIGRSMEDAAIVTPTAIVDEYGFSFAGSQSPETSYVLDGMNVTDPRFGTQGISLLNNFVQELEVKTGNFLPEYGRSTGGVVNVVTKSGSNEYHGSVFMNYNPRSLVQPDGEPLGRLNEAIGYQLTPGEGAFDADFGFEVGGPITKDKLWFYAGFAPVLEKETWTRYYRLRNTTAGTNTKIDGTDQVYEDTSKEYQYTGKLTYLINENNSLKASVSGLTRGVVGHWGSFNRTPENIQTNSETYDDYVVDLIANYDGKFLGKKLILNAMVGYHTQGLTNPDKSGTGRAAPTNQYRFSTLLDNFEDAPAVCESAPDLRCRVNRYYTGGMDFYEDGTTASRLAGKVSLGYLFDAFGSHNAKGGIDIERTNYNYNRGYSGGGRWYVYDGVLGPRDGLVDYTFLARGYGLVTNLASDNPADVTYLQTIKSQGVSTSTAFFLQDQWSPIEGLFVNYGLRWELQRLIDEKTAISPDVKINDNIAPRVQVVYDWTKTGRSKVFGSWGRFYEAIPLDMVVRAFGLETSIYESRDISTCAPNGGAPTGTAWSPNDPALGCPAIYDGWYNVHHEEALFLQAGTVSPVDPNIKGMFVDQYGLGAEYEILPDFSVGVEYQGRRLGRAIEDLSSNDGVTYFIGNPGEGEPFDYYYPDMAGNMIPIAQDPTGVNTNDLLTGIAYRVPFPKAERKYDGLTLKARKGFSKNWLMEASYTWSQLTGNYAGLFRPENDQLDPNLTSEYDLPTLMTNKEGYLPGDRTHFFKLYGAYNWDISQRFNVMTGAAFRAYSGVPISALGAHPIYGPSEAFIIPRGMGGRTEGITKFDLKAGLRYVIKAPYEVAFTVDLFNVFNSKEATAVDENYTIDAVQPIVGMDCANRDGANESDPIAGLQADCPGLADLKTVDGFPVTVNENYGRPTSFAAPFSMRLGLSLTF